MLPKGLYSPEAAHLSARQHDAALELKSAILEVCDKAEAAVRAGKLVGQIFDA